MSTETWSPAPQPVVFPTVDPAGESEGWTRGHAAGYAAGLRRAAEELAAREAELGARHAAAVAGERARTDRAVTVLDAAARALEARAAPVLADADTQVLAAALSIAEVVLGCELSDARHAARAALARALSAPRLGRRREGAAPPGGPCAGRGAARPPHHSSTSSRRLPRSRRRRRRLPGRRARRADRLRPRASPRGAYSDWRSRARGLAPRSSPPRRPSASAVSRRSAGSALEVAGLPCAVGDPSRWRRRAGADRAEVVASARGACAACRWGPSPGCARASRPVPYAAAAAGAHRPRPARPGARRARPPDRRRGPLVAPTVPASDRAPPPWTAARIDTPLHPASGLSTPSSPWAAASGSGCSPGPAWASPRCCR